MKDHLTINRSLQDDKFRNWRLGQEFLQCQTSAFLPGPLAVADTGSANDYLHTRAAVLHNHLHVCGRQVFLFARGVDGMVSLWNSLPCPSASPPFVLSRVTALPPVELPQGAAYAHGACTADSSVAIVTSSSEVDASATSRQCELLVSCGMGDLRIIHVSEDGSVPAGPSLAVHPLREQTPLVGVKPFKIEAAYRTAAGALRCVLWTIRNRTAQQDAACEIYLVTLSTLPADVPTVIDVKLMACSSLPPHSIMCDPSTDAILLACDPAELDVMPDTCQHSQPATNLQVAAINSNGAANGSGPLAVPSVVHPMDTDVEHIECRPAGWRGSQQQCHDDDHDSEVDPRTLAEAAARLAKYTSDEPVGALPPQQWADLYKEAGPEDLSADSGCELCLWRAGGGGEGQGRSTCQPWSVSFGAHKVLTSDTPGLLAVTDDVDACVVRFGWRRQGEEPVGESSSAGPGRGSEPYVEHVATIPALAYVAAGKTQRKHLLVGPPRSLLPTSPCAAVLVESTKFMYVYGQISPGQHHGQQAVLDMGLATDERVMGAALISGEPWTTVGKEQAVVLVLTQRRLLAFVLGTN